jgi:PPP family 3-phenylpropionic acid transporter
MNVALIIFYVTTYAVQGVLIPFFVLWLTGRGISAESATLLVSLLFLCKIISNPVAAHLADRSGSPRAVLLVLSGGVALVYCIYTLNLSPPVLFVCAAVASFLTAPLFPLADRLAIGTGERAAWFFGWKRVWGSLGFATSTMLAGHLMEIYGADGVMVLVAGAAVMAFLAMLGVPETPRRPSHAGDRSPLSHLLANRTLVLIVFAAALTQASNGFLYSASAVHWRDDGYGPSSIAMFWGVGIGTEILGFLVSPKLVQVIRPVILLAVAAAGSTIRWAVLGAADGIGMIAAGQALQFFTIALNSVAFAALVGTLGDERGRTTMFAIYMTLAMGVFIAITAASGAAFQAFTGLSGYYAMIPFTLLAMCLAIVANARLNVSGSQVPSR